MSRNPIDPNSKMFEEREPAAGLATVPIWLIVLLGVLVYWGQLHLDKFGGEFDPRVYGTYTSLKEVQKANPDVGVDMVPRQRFTRPPARHAISSAVGDCRGFRR